jgi:hypothetical protein
VGALEVRWNKGEPEDDYTFFNEKEYCVCHIWIGFFIYEEIKLAFNRVVCEI